MALTQEDLGQIRLVMDEAIAVHPRFDQFVTKDELEINFRKFKEEIVDEVAEVITEGLTMVAERFDLVEQRLDRLEKAAH
jgi:hypothetical protein